MNTTVTKTAVMAMMLAIPVALMAQTSAPPMPEAVRGLKRFIGKWDSRATLTVEGKTYSLDYHVEGKEIAGGNGVYIDEWFTHPDLGTLKGGNLIGYDPFDSRIHLYSVDNMGTTHEHSGEWRAPGHLYVEHNSMRDGKKYVEKIDFTFRNDNELRYTIVATLDGREVESGDGVFKRAMMAGTK